MRWLVAWLWLVLLSLPAVEAQTVLPGVGECQQPSPDFCLQPSATLRVGAKGVGSWQDALPWDFATAYGLMLNLKGNPSNLEFDAVKGLSYKLSAALWWDAFLSLDVLEAYADFPVDNFHLSIGKRTRYSGPWDDGLMGRMGHWGVYVDAANTDRLTTVPIEFEAAYLPNPGFVGGLVYIGLGFDFVQIGSFVDVIQATTGDSTTLNILYYPRLGLQTDWVSLYWQKDRGFWNTFSLPIGQSLAYISQSSADFGPLNQLRLESFVWWNPNWDLLKSNTYIPPDQDRNVYFLLNPQKLMFGLDLNWQDFIKVGADFSRAPVEAIRIYAQFWLK